MRNLLFIIVLFLLGCSSKPQEAWLVEINSYLEKFKTAKLTSSENEAQMLKTLAINSAKKSADIDYLQIIELTDQALNLATTKPLNFDYFYRLDQIENHKTNSAYASFLDSKDFDTEDLPKQYRDFASYVQKKSYKKAFDSATSIKDPVSKIIALSLLASYDNDKKIYDEILKISKPLGYKNVTISALKNLQKLSTEDEAKKIELLINELL